MEKFKVSFEANNQQLKSIGTKHASDTYADIEATFVLGEKWTDMDSVSAVWWNDFTRVATVLDSQGKCVVPHEVLTRKGCVRVNLVGSIVEGDELITRLTSYSAEAVQVNEKIKLTGSETSELTPSQFEQFVTEVKADADRAETVRDEAEAARDVAVSAKDTAVNAVEGFEDIVDTATATAVQTIQGEGATQVTAIQTEGTTQVASVRTEGSTQVTAVQDKGDEVLDSIPADYTQLSQNVTDLKSEIIAFDSVYTAEATDTSILWSKSNTSVTNNGDGTYTLGTGDYGTLIFGSQMTLQAGVYKLFGVPAGFSFLSTDDTVGNAFVTNSKTNPIYITLSEETKCFLGYRSTQAPSSAIVITPYLRYPIGELANAKAESVANAFSLDMKKALIECFNNVAWANENGQIYCDALMSAMGYPHDTTAVLYKDGYVTYNQGSANTDYAVENGGITIRYKMDAQSALLYPAGVIVQDGIFASNRGTIRIFNNDGACVGFVDEVNRWGKAPAQSYTEYSQSWNATPYTMVSFSVDIRYLDDSYMYDKTTGQVWFAGKNTPYYGMSNISEASA